MDNRQHLTPWLFLAGILMVLAVIAGTDLLNPVIRFIHSDQGGYWQLGLCVLAGILGFRLAYVLLDSICRYYAARFDERIERETYKKQKHLKP